MAPFPYIPLMAVLASLVSYLVMLMNLFSYAGYMVEYLGAVDDKDKSGYYAGLLSSSFMIGRSLSSHFWGVVSDRFGCRFVMVVGLVATVFLSVAFGCSTTFIWAFLFRFLLGLLNGMIVASKTIVSEVCGKEHETVGMGVVTTSWSIGTVIGPGIGGLLSDPAKHHPHTFSKFGLFGRHPYLLPNLVGAGLALLALPLVLVFLEDNQCAESIVQTAKAWFHSFGDTDKDDEEHNGGKAKDATARTLASLSVQQKAINPKITSRQMQTETTLLINARNGSGQATDKNLGCDEPGDFKPPSLLAQSHIRTLLVIEGVYSFAYSGFDEVFTLWSLSTVAKGGLDWTSPQIGQVFLVCGLMVLIFEIFAVPNITPRLGVKMSQRLGSVFEIPVYVLIPLLSPLNGAGFPVTNVSLILLFVCYVSSNSFYVGVSLAFNNATGPDRRGELNGLAATVCSFARASAPIFCSSLFAFSISGHHPFPFDYPLVFYVIAALRLAVALMGWNTIGDIVGAKSLHSDSCSEASDSTLSYKF